MSLWQTRSGSEFHAVVAAAAKARLPTAVRVLGTKDVVLRTNAVFNQHHKAAALRRGIAAMESHRLCKSVGPYFEIILSRTGSQ